MIASRPQEGGARLFRRVWLVPAVVYLAIGGVATHATFSVSGDEPHYLMMCESLLADHDLDLANNYSADDGARFGHAGLVAGPHVRPDRAGRSLPVHDVGLPIVLLPAYAVATHASPLVPPGVLTRFRTHTGRFAYSLLGLFVTALVALAAGVLVRALRPLVSDTGASVATLALFLSPPVAMVGFMAYPEVPALLVACAAVWLAYRPEGRVRLRSAWLVAAGLGLLPWLHQKFFPLALGLLFVVWWRQRGRRPEMGAAGRAWLAATLLIPWIGRVAWTPIVWGNWGGPLLADRTPFSVAAFERGSLGLLLDRECGLFAWAPIYLLLGAAWWRSRRDDWALALPALLLFVPSAAHDQWWGGWSPAARFLAPVVPLFAVPMARLWNDPRARPAVLALAPLQLYLAAYAWQRPTAAWPQGTARHEGLMALPAIGPVLNDFLPTLLRPGAAAPAPWAWWAALCALTLAFVLWTGGRSPRVRASRP